MIYYIVQTIPAPRSQAALPVVNRRRDVPQVADRDFRTMSEPMHSTAPDLDRIAMVLSGLCLVHCLALPLLFLVLPFVGGVADSHWHVPLLAVALPVSIVAIVIGYRRHGNRGIVAGIALGLALLVAGATVGHALLGSLADRLLTVAGSLTLAAMHWQNSVKLREYRCRALARG